MCRTVKSSLLKQRATEASVGTEIRPFFYNAPIHARLTPYICCLSKPECLAVTYVLQTVYSPLPDD